MRKTKEKIFTIGIMVAFVLMTVTTVTKAASYSNGGVIMHYNLSLVLNTWTANTYCFEDMDSKVSLFLNKSKGGELLYSNIVYGRIRMVVPGSSLSGTYAAISKSNSSAKYGRSVHGLVYHNTNTPFFSALDIVKEK